MHTLTPVGSTTMLDVDERGTAYVLFSITERGSDAYLSDASSAIRGEFEFDHFGMLPAEPGIDLNGDRLDDILIGAPGADAVTTILTPGAGQGVRGLRRLDSAGTAARRPDRRPDQPDHHRQRRLPGGSGHRPGRDLPERLRRRRRVWTPPTSPWPPARASAGTASSPWATASRAASSASPRAPGRNSSRPPDIPDAAARPAATPPDARSAADLFVRDAVRRFGLRRHVRRARLQPGRPRHPMVGLWRRFRRGHHSRRHAA